MRKPYPCLTTIDGPFRRAAGLLLVLVTAVASADVVPLYEVRALHSSGQIVSLAAIVYDARERFRGGSLLNVILERSADGLYYEIEFLDAAGELRELYYDATTGELAFYEIYKEVNNQLIGFRYDARTGEPVGIEIEADER